MIYALLGTGGLVSWFLIQQRWQRGLVLLILYLPVAGAIILLSGNNPLAILAKDLLFVLPLYAAFLLRGVSLSAVRVPPVLALSITALTVIVILQMANPADAGIAVALVGAKVWLFYIPLFPITLAALTSERELIQMLRWMVILVPLPCIVGLMQYAGSSLLGHQATITAFYGEAAAGATQNFNAFDYGAPLYRLPSTFTSVSHYSGYLQTMLIPTYCVARADGSRNWRRYATALMPLITVSCLLSGSRSAFIFVPVLLVAIFIMDRVIVGAMVWLASVPTLVLLTLYVTGFELDQLFGGISQLAIQNAHGLATASVADALEKYPFGIGTGMNTNAARHVLSQPGQLAGYESHYAKTIVELGIIGLIVMVAVFAAMLLMAWRVRSQTQGTRWSSIGAATLTYFAIMPVYALKGWPLDWEPGNVYFWLLAGVVCALPNIICQSHPTEPPLLLRPVPAGPANAAPTLAALRHRNRLEAHRGSRL